MSSDIKGLSWDIQRFNIHDGSGIRTLVFFKGCPLSCLWCSNPEGQKSIPEVLIDKSKCRQAGICEEICHLAAIKIESNYPQIDRGTCDG